MSTLYCDTSRMFSGSDCLSMETLREQPECSAVTRRDLEQDGEETVSQNAMSCYKPPQHGEAARKERNAEGCCQKCARLKHFPLLLLKCSGGLTIKEAG